MGFLNEKHIDSVDVSVPIILAEMNPNKYNVIDGHHRLEKAYRNGIESISAYKLPVDLHIAFFASHRSWRNQKKSLTALSLCCCLALFIFSIFLFQ